MASPLILEKGNGKLNKNVFSIIFFCHLKSGFANLFLKFSLVSYSLYFLLVLLSFIWNISTFLIFSFLFDRLNSLNFCLKENFLLLFQLFCSYQFGCFMHDCCKHGLNFNENSILFILSMLKSKRRTKNRKLFLLL